MWHSRHMWHNRHLWHMWHNRHLSHTCDTIDTCDTTDTCDTCDTIDTCDTTDTCDTHVTQKTLVPHMWHSRHLSHTCDTIDTCDTHARTAGSRDSSVVRALGLWGKCGRFISRVSVLTAVLVSVPTLYYSCSMWRPSHLVKSKGGMFQVNTHSPLAEQSWSGLTAVQALCGNASGKWASSQLVREHLSTLV